MSIANTIQEERKDELQEERVLHINSIANTTNGKRDRNPPKPKTRPDALFNFTQKLDWLIWSIENKCLAPRYNIEDVKYLGIKGIRKIAFPMKCFCDINLHQLKDHLEWYGYYGVAFTKEWGMKQRIQPVQYIISESLLAKDFSEAFKLALDNKEPNAANNQLRNYIIHEMLYYKPYSGSMSKRSKKIEKCFADESEWRYIPDITFTGIPRLIHERDFLNEDFILFANRILQTEQSASLQFEYSDIKYIIVKTQDDFDRLIEVISKGNIKEQEKYILTSKILVWDSSKGDF